MIIKRFVLKHKGLLVLVVILSIMASLGNVGIAVLLQLVIDVAVSGNNTGFWQIVIGATIYLLVFGILLYLQSYVGKRFICMMSKRLRESIYAGIQKHNPQDFSTNSTADYLSALTNDIKILEENYTQPVLKILQNGMIFVFTFVLLLKYSPYITGALIVCMVFMFLIPSLFGKTLQHLQKRYSDRLSSFTGKVKDLLSGYEVIRSFQINIPVLHEYNKENDSLTKSKLSADNLIAFNESLSMVLAAMTQLVVIFMASWFVMNDQFSGGVLLALIQLSSNFVSPILMVMQSLPPIKGSRPIIKKLEALIEYKDLAFTGIATPVFQNNLCMDKVIFQYNSDHPVIQNLSTVIERGKKYAIVGASGCGKTTMIRLLTASYNGYVGSIMLDGKDIHELDAEKYAHLFSVIHQHVFLFDNDIRMNIGLYGKFSEQAWEDALQISGVALFLPKLTDGLDTQVGENGCNLSGGQRQRVAVARAILHKAPILILDEGTSAIDMQTAYYIENQLLKVEGLTLLTITHNMNKELLGKYNDILFMEFGTITQCGTLDEILKQNGSFSRFYTLQV